MRTLLSSLVLTAFAAPASAFFVGGKAPAPAPAPAKLDGLNIVADRTVLPLNQVGLPDPEVAGLPAGFNDGVPLEHALKLLLPKGWKAALAPDLAKTVLVSWTSGLTWLEALEQVAVQTDTAANVHWNDRAVTMSPMPRESSMVQTVAVAAPSLTVDVYSPAGDPVDSAPSPVFSSPGAYIPPSSYEAPARPVYAPVPAPVSRNDVAVAPAPPYMEPPVRPMPARYVPPPAPAPVTVDSTPEIPVAAPVSVASETPTSTPTATSVDSSPATAAAPEAPPSYEDLGDFLREEVKVDRVAMSLPETIKALIPPTWTVDVRDDQNVLDNLRMDLTYVGPRGAALNAIGTKENLVLIPYIEFSKVVVTRGQVN